MCECVNIGSLNLGAEAATVTETQIIGHDDEEVGPLVGLF